MTCIKHGMGNPISQMGEQFPLVHTGIIAHEYGETVTCTRSIACCIRGPASLGLR